MECITIICDDKMFKTRRRTIDGFFPIEPDQSNIRLDVDPTYFLPILENLRENFETLVSDSEFQSQMSEIRVADLELDVGGTTFWTSKETLSKSEYFRTTFNWGQSITFIDRNPDKFRQLLNHLRGTEGDPGIYAEFYLVNRPLELMETEELNPDKVMEPYIYRETPFLIENNLGKIRSNLLNLKYDPIKQSYIKDTNDKNQVTFTLNLSSYGSMIDNIKLISNRGIKEYEITCGVDGYCQVIKDNNHNAYLFENLRSCPKLYCGPFEEIRFNFQLTGAGYLQLTFDLHDKNMVNIRGTSLSQVYNVVKYYGKSNEIDALINDSFNRHTIMFMIRSVHSNFILKEKSSQQVLYTTNPLSSIEYAIKNKLDPSFIYVPIDENLRRNLHSYLKIEINQTVDIWMVNRYIYNFNNGFSSLSYY